MDEWKTIYSTIIEKMKELGVPEDTIVELMFVASTVEKLKCTVFATEAPGQVNPYVIACPYITLSIDPSQQLQRMLRHVSERNPKAVRPALALLAIAAIRTALMQ